MTDRVKNQPGPSTIVKNTNLWPASFPQLEKEYQVCVRSYIFSDSNKVHRFLKFLKDKFPDRKVDVKQLDNGNVSVTAVNDDSGKNCCNASWNGAETCCLKSPNGNMYYWGCCFSKKKSGSTAPAGAFPHCGLGSIKNTQVVSDQCVT